MIDSGGGAWIAVIEFYHPPGSCCCVKMRAAMRRWTKWPDEGGRLQSLIA